MTDEEVEITQEKVCYDAKRGAVVQQEVAVEDQDEGKSKGDEEEEEDEDKPVCLSGLSVKVKEKHPTK